MPPDINDIFEMDCFKEVMDRGNNVNKSHFESFGKAMMAVIIGIGFGLLFCVGVIISIHHK